MPLGALIGGLFGTANNQLEQDFNAEQASLNRRFQREERLASQEYDLDMWNRTNEYNSIASQIERGRMAGVSPNTILGNGVGTSGIANPVQTTPMSGSQASYSSGLGSTLALNIAQSDLLESQADKNKAEEKKIEEETRGKKLENDFFEDSYEDKLKEISSRVENLEIDELLKRQEYQLGHINIAAARESFKWMARFNEARYSETMLNLNNLYSEYQLKRQQILNAEKQGDLIDEQIDTEKAKQSDLYASAELKSAQKGLVEEQEDLTEAQSVEAKIKALEDAYRYKVSQQIGLPLGTQPFEFQYFLWKTGDIQPWCDNVVKPDAEAKFKPNDWMVTEGSSSSKSSTSNFSGTLVGVELGGSKDETNETESHTITYDSRKGIKNP